MRKRILPHVDALGGTGGVQANPDTFTSNKTQGQGKSAEDIAKMCGGDEAKAIAYVSNHQDECKNVSLMSVKSACEQFKLGQTTQKTLSQAVQEFGAKFKEFLTNIKPNSESQKVSNNEIADQESNATLDQNEIEAMKEDALQGLQDLEEQQAAQQMDAQIKKAVSEFGLQ